MICVWMVVRLLLSNLNAATETEGKPDTETPLGSTRPRYETSFGCEREGNGIPALHVQVTVS
jgi:hypothetical protein